MFITDPHIIIWGNFVFAHLFLYLFSKDNKDYTSLIMYGLLIGDAGRVMFGIPT